MRTLYESILDTNIIDRAETATKEMLDWYDRWDKFDKDFWKIFPIEAGKVGVNRGDFKDMTIVDKFGGISKLKFTKTTASGACDHPLQLKKVWMDTIKTLYKKHFGLDAKFKGNVDCMDWVADNAAAKIIGGQILFGNLTTEIGHYSMMMKKYKL